MVEVKRVFADTLRALSAIKSAPDEAAIAIDVAALLVLFAADVTSQDPVELARAMGDACARMRDEFYPGDVTPPH